MVITGAFSYTGKYATRLLLSCGYRVRTLTFHSDRQNEFGRSVEAFPYNFDHSDRLEQSLRGAFALINTYWVRFPRGSSTFEVAVGNSNRLIDAAKKAGIPRIIHVSIANPSLQSSLGYYKGKAQLEQAVIHSGLSYTILRPTVIFGLEDILINNIAWFLRRFPAFGIPGDGRYPVRPIYVEDMARLMVDAVEKHSNEIVDAVGPETYAFEELVGEIAKQIGERARLVHVPMPLAYAATRLTGWFLGDVILTWEEYRGLMGGLLAPDGLALGETQLSQWLADNRDRIGRSYASEIARHYADSAPDG